ncbi:MAG: hypothetical protein ACOYXN_00400 [Acidobacteriota bacterium]
MEKRVIFRDNQEVQAKDFNGQQDYGADGLRHLIQDCVSTGLHVSGGAVAQQSATEIVVAPLRFYNDGMVYASELTQALNLFAYLPVVAKKIVAVVVWGEEIESDVEPRDFLIDITTGETEPRAVAMTTARIANVNTLPGAESADPQPPVIQSGHLAIAYVTLTPAGIETIENLGAAHVHELADHAARLGVVETWKGQAEPRIQSIATDLSALAKRTDGLAAKRQLVEIAADVARLKEAAQLPDTYASYGADYFGDDAESDPAGAGYACRLEGAGLLFPFAGQAVAALALFNPYDAGIRRHTDDLVLPAYTSAVRIRTDGYAGDLSLSQYQVQNHTVRKYVRTVWEYRYGPHWLYYWPWYHRHFWTYQGATRSWVAPYYGYWVKRSDDAYEVETATTTVNGVIVSQTFLVANAMWLTKVGLYLTQVASTGDVHVIVCETEGGKPLLSRTITQVTVAPAALQAYPTETPVEIPPVLLEAGKRYALCLITQGAHRAALVSGNAYTQGTLFFGTDGDYFVGDLTKDLMFAVYGATFARARTEVQLQPISLAGGIQDLAVQAAQVVPHGTEIRYEVQVGGKWYALGDSALVLSTGPDVVPLRAVLLGTSDLAPGFVLQAGAVTGSRAGAAIVHWSSLRTLGAPSTEIKVQIVAAGYDAAHHTLTCDLVDGVTTYNPTATTSALEPDGEATRFTFTFTIAGGIASYKIKLSGTGDGAVAPFAITERVDVAS